MILRTLLMWWYSELALIQFWPLLSFFLSFRVCPPFFSQSSLPRPTNRLSSDDLPMTLPWPLCVYDLLALSSLLLPIWPLPCLRTSSLTTPLPLHISLPSLSRHPPYPSPFPYHFHCYHPPPHSMAFQGPPPGWLGVCSPLTMVFNRPRVRFPSLPWPDWHRVKFYYLDLAWWYRLFVICYLFVCLHLFACVYLRVYLFNLSVSLGFCDMFVGLCFCITTFLTSVFIMLVWKSKYLSVYLSVWCSVCLSICCVYLLIQWSVFLCMPIFSVRVYFVYIYVSV